MRDGANILVHSGIVCKKSLKKQRVIRYRKSKKDRPYRQYNDKQEKDKIERMVDK